MACSSATSRCIALVREMAPDLHPEAPVPIEPRDTLAPIACPFANELEPSRLGGVAGLNRALTDSV
jgi:hypothetical protein